jgi:hypothetical protein
MLNLRENKYHARRKFFALAGQVFIYDQYDNLVCYVRQKLLKLKEEITAFTDESQTAPVLNIKARAVIDFAAAYDVVDSMTGEKVGAVKRKGLRSIFKDEWLIMDAGDNVIASVREESGIMAILSRIINLIPQKYVIETADSGTLIGRINQIFDYFVHKFDIDFSMDNEGLLDRRLGLGVVILLLIIERRQNI